MNRLTVTAIATLAFVLASSAKQADASCGHYVVSGAQEFATLDLLAADLPDPQPCSGPGCHGRQPTAPTPVAPTTSVERRQETANHPAGSLVAEDQDPPKFDSFSAALLIDSFYPRIDRPPQG